MTNSVRQVIFNDYLKTMYQIGNMNIHLGVGKLSFPYFYLYLIG